MDSEQRGLLDNEAGLFDDLLTRTGYCRSVGVCSSRAENPGRNMKGLFNHPAYVRFWAASTTSVFGSSVTTVALQVLVVISLHGSATDVGLVNAGRAVPYALLGLFVGALVDRHRRLPILVLSDFCRGLLLGTIPLLALLGLLQVPVLVAFMVAFGTLSLVNDAAFQSFLPRLVPRTLLTQANARLDQSAAIAQTSGPVLAGGLIALIGAPLAILVDAVSYVLSGIMLLTIRIAEPGTNSLVGERNLRQEVAEGLSWVYRHRMLGPLALSTHTWFLFSAVYGAIFAPYALNVLHLGVLGLGVVLALAGIGGLLGSFASGQLGHLVGVGRVIAACRALEAMAIALMALAMTPSDSGPRWMGLTLVGAAQLLLGVGLGAENPNEMGYRQAVTPDRLQGRMNATNRSLNRAMLVIGAPLGGMFADAFRYGPALLLSASGLMVGAIALWLSPFHVASYADVESV